MDMDTDGIRYDTGTRIQDFLKNIWGPQWISGIRYDTGTGIEYVSNMGT
jgi:hypothetical protein